MGRVKDFKDLGKKGPGRKSKKQGDPGLEGAYKSFTEKKDGKVKKKTGGHIKQRLKKREMKKMANEVVKTRKKKKNILEEDESMEVVEKKRLELDQEGGSDGNYSNNENMADEGK